jgi:NAD(P)-dependent dehydrogenase (short-subunit alcohol dehydrogenase family)
LWQQATHAAVVGRIRPRDVLLSRKRRIMPSGTVLIVGASRGLGLALAQEYLARGWRVIATVRGAGRTQLHGLAEAAGEQLTVERVDITAATQVAALHERLAGTSVDLLFVNAGISNGDVSVMDVPTETFTDVMVTNALSPVRFVETFQDLVPPSGTIAVMSSRQGSLTLNTTAGYEVYRASKSALNQLMRSFAARHADDPRTLLLISPGWVNTELGGPGARLTVDQSVPGVVDTIEKHAGESGIHFVDYLNQTLPW